jgi:hypothetical protein
VISISNWPAAKFASPYQSRQEAIAALGEASVMFSAACAYKDTQTAASFARIGTKRAC